MIGKSNLYNRNNWIAEQLAQLKGCILDVGAGELQWKPYCQHLEYFSQDFCKYNPGGDGKGLQCKTWDTSKIDIVCDIIEIPESDKSFDAILCSEVLDHIPDPVKAAKELDRLLKPGGTMLLTESFCGLTNQSPYFYYTGLSENWYRYHFKDYDIQIQYNGNYYEWMAQELLRMVSQGDINEMQAKLIIFQMEHAIEKHPRSYEILCFGLLVKAIKNV
jgi:ubiquinone/menaquinone biosynthesis C-methylase UbiE